MCFREHGHIVPQERARVEPAIKTYCLPSDKEGSIVTKMEIEDVWLSSSVKVAKYRELKANKDKNRIADFIQERFTERYIAPLRGSKKNGFAMMAVSCLMIEALESFWQGWPKTDGNKSEEAFKLFFNRCARQNSPLGVFAKAKDFYKGVRSGILHQAETTKGWRIQRKGCLYNQKDKIINATQFQNELECALRIYCEELKTSDWDADVWCKLRKKMDSVIDHCRPTPQRV